MSLDKVRAILTYVIAEFFNYGVANVTLLKEKVQKLISILLTIMTT